MRILIAEDDSSAQYILKEIFHKHELIMCNDGLDALAEFTHSDKDFDLIITDFQMPNMNGLSFINALRKTDRKIRIVLYSGALFDSKQYKLIEELGVEKVIMKDNLDDLKSLEESL